ncbi:BTB/POZ and MATH domain-containing protein 1-like [Triticum dicoccoides]|uniref:BTB/POZ and MATH domain-containing protein 1-like n=1 Tax=Triticum dicoccoides TaxID=85692 RepID=UPI000E79B5F3|nr:BTB/POZ and MATH domain-containing protein 1-like [Triticum dicoccoides]
MRTASMCTACTVRGTHTFKIAGYSLHRGLGVGNFIPSASFDIGGYLWRVLYFPDGETEMENGDHASVFLDLVSKATEVRALFEVRLVDQTNKLPPSVVLSQKTPIMFNNNEHRNSMGDDFLQPLAYLLDDSLVLECDVTVLKEFKVTLTVTTFDIQVPPSDLGEHLRELLENGEGADVVFEVEGEVFPAHKSVVAGRSPVFRAQLFGPMSDRAKQRITVEDMQPAVFKALLHFIYTDSLPSMEDLDGDEGKEMVKHLLVAADRYAMERMKVMCESILCNSLDVESVTATLALADQHHCSNLRDACLEFITSPDRMDDVMATQGYAHLKRSCPSIVIDVFERAKRSRKI